MQQAQRTAHRAQRTPRRRTARLASGMPRAAPEAQQHSAAQEAPGGYFDGKFRVTLRLYGRLGHPAAASAMCLHLPKGQGCWLPRMLSLWPPDAGAYHTSGVWLPSDGQRIYLFFLVDPRGVLDFFFSFFSLGVMPRAESAMGMMMV